MEVARMCFSAFHPHQKVRLLPFVLSTVIYMIQPYPHQCLIGVIFKILPMMSLIGYVLMTRSQFPSQTRRISLETLVPRDTYSSYILFGLIASMAADVLLTIQYLGLLGVVCFTIAHIFYVIGINESGRHKGCNSSVTSLFVLLFINLLLALQTGVEGYLKNIIMFAYFAPLFLAAWKASAAFRERPESKECMVACIGALSFIFSDTLIVYYHSRYKIPFGIHIYMLTYYGAQFGWAVSTSDLRND